MVYNKEMKLVSSMQTALKVVLYKTILETAIHEWKPTQHAEYLKKTGKLNEFWFRTLGLKRSESNALAPPV